MVIFSTVGIFVPSASAFLLNAKMPVCMDGPTEMKVDNRRILEFKRSTRNQYLDRGFVEGRVVVAPEVKNDHDHFSISIGPGSRDTIEIIYNSNFGDMSAIRVGDRVVVCGDYITANARTGSYDPSPDGAIIHWVHFNPGTRTSSSNHEHGFIMAGSDLIGFDDAPAGDWDGRIIPAPQPSKKPKQKNGPGVKPADRRGQSTRPRPSGDRWKACRSLQECSDRNH